MHVYFPMESSSGMKTSMKKEVAVTVAATSSWRLWSWQYGSKILQVRLRNTGRRDGPRKNYIYIVEFVQISQTQSFDVRR